MKRVVDWLPRRANLVLAVIYTAAVFVGSVIKLPREIDLGEGRDKLLHLGAYLGMTILWSFTTRRPFRSAVCCALFGGLIELIQALIPYRSCEWGDFIANSIGAAVGGVFAVGLGALRRYPEIRG